MGWIAEHVKAYPHNMSWRLYNNAVTFRKKHFTPHRTALNSSWALLHLFMICPTSSYRLPVAPELYAYRGKQQTLPTPVPPAQSPPLLPSHKAWEAAAEESDSRSAPWAEKVCKDYSKVRSGHRSQDNPSWTERYSQLDPPTEQTAPSVDPLKETLHPSNLLTGYMASQPTPPSTPLPKCGKLTSE